VVCSILAYWYRYARRQRRVAKALQNGSATGEPPSLHPSLDPNRCISIGACANACPEGEIIAMFNGAPELIEPTRCIGHGACAAACPVDAISLVFGTATRGMDIPHVRDTFETNVPGIYIAGELGGMGLIRNAVTQGAQAIDYIAKTLSGNGVPHDVAIIGAGAAGISATLQSKKKRLKYLTLEQEDIGGTVLRYPRQKIVMTQPMELPLYGKCNFREIKKEELLALWHEVIRKTGTKIHTSEKLEHVGGRNGAFEIRSSKGTYRAKKLLLAIGRGGTPRKLGVPGEKSSKVAYKLIEPEQYARKRVLVVGGGDSAVEAALALAREPGTRVSVSYRRGEFTRIKPKNRQLIEAAINNGTVEMFFESQVQRIDRDKVTLDVAGESCDIPNDYVLVFAGGEMPTKFLKGLGIDVTTKFGEQ
jgi:thioredoxin reductase (NADPH)